MIKKLSKYIKGYKKNAVMTSVFVSIEVILEVLIPLVIGNLIDFGIEVGNMQMILKLGSTLVLMAIFSLIFGFLSGSNCATASTGFAKNLRQAMFYKIQNFSFYNIDKFSTSSLITRITTDTNMVQDAFQMIIRMAIRAPLMLSLTVISTFILSYKVALINLAICPIIALLIVIILKKVHPSIKKVLKDYDNLNRVVGENISGMRVVKAYVREDYEIEKFNKSSEDIYKDYSKAKKIMALTDPLIQFIMYGTMLLVCWIVANIIVKSGGTELQIGSLSTLLAYSMQGLMSLMMFSFCLVSISLSRPAGERIVEILNENPTITSKEKPIKKIPSGEIEFRDVSFSYSDDISKLCLQDINLHISSGETVGILGATGSSKSTLISLIPRLYDVTSGEVLVGGKNVKDYDLVTLRDNVSIVLQKNVLFSGTVKENLLWGNKNATKKEIDHALNISQSKEFVDKMEQGLDTHLEQGGTNVSGGQRQRLCIARALLKKPKILILDDSTSAVDTKTDKLIRTALKNEMSNTTKIIIAQRVQSVMDADKIVILNKGKIEAVGKHKNLLQTCKIYKDIYETQIKKEEKTYASKKK